MKLILHGHRKFEGDSVPLNPIEHPSASSEFNSRPVHGLIHEGTVTKLSQWFNPILRGIISSSSYMGGGGAKAPPKENQFPL